MAIIFGKKPLVTAPASAPAPVAAPSKPTLFGAKPPPKNLPAAPTQVGGGLKPVVKVTAAVGIPPAKSAGLSFIKKGAAAVQTMAQEDVKAEARSKDNVFGFWLPNGGAAAATFLDGELKEGMLDIPFFHQHSVFMNGSYNNHFICTVDEEPCPICEGGDNASFVGVLTVIDHSEYTSKKDGKVYKDNIRKFVAKRNTIKTLLTMAKKRGGLAGCTFDISRTGDKEPGVGNVFDFTEKRDLKALKALYETKDRLIAPLDYNKMLASMYHSAADLRKLGFGSQAPAIGTEQGVTEDYDSTM